MGQYADLLKSLSLILRFQPENSGNTAFHIAVLNGDQQLLKEYMDLGISPYVKNEQGFTAIAVLEDILKSLKNELVENRESDLKQSNYKLNLYQSIYEDLKNFKRENDVLFRRYGLFRNTLLHLAVVEWDIDAIKVLMNHGLSPCLKNEAPLGQSALDYAVELAPARGGRNHKISEAILKAMKSSPFLRPLEESESESKNEGTQKRERYCKRK